MDSEHFAKLKESSYEEWNQWRDNNLFLPDLRDADLSRADLYRLNLSGAKLTDANLSLAKLTRTNLTDANLSHAKLADAMLHRANLRDADLTGADLTGAYLNVADLTGAKLTDANLSHAKLTRSNLTDANLSHAKLWDADLTGADLTGAHLSGADLSGAKLMSTSFVNTNLKDVQGLESCSHSGPSFLDFHTLAESGVLPILFLRGCGLSDRLIEYLPSILNEAIQFYSCFISHSTKDKDFAERLHADLQNKGVRCWYAPEDLKIGDPFRQRIDEAIRLHEKLLVILSEHSVQSSWVREEVESCLEKEDREDRTVLFPVRLDNAIMDTDKAWAASIRRRRHVGDFRNWKDHDSYAQSFTRLMKDLRTEGARPPLAKLPKIKTPNKSDAD